MASLTLLVLVVGLIVLFAVLGALVIIGVVLYRNQTKIRDQKPGSADELNADRAAEIVSTTNLLNP